MRINHNIAALNTHRQLGQANQGQQNSMEKLSSGLRINKAGDDAAGLAISEKMRGQIRGLDQAKSNAQDGISLIQTAEGAMNESHSILQRMRELSVQSANDTNTDTDRKELQKEVDQLSEELTRIGETTEFNTQSLLDGSFEGKFQIGANEGQNLELSIGDMGADALGVSGDGEGSAKVEVNASAWNGTVDLEDGDHTLSVVDLGETNRVDGSDYRYALQNEEGNIVAVGQNDGKKFDFLDDAVSMENLERDGATTASNDVQFSDSVRSGEITIEGVSTGSTSTGSVTATASIEVEGLDTGSYEVKGSGSEGDAVYEGINWDGSNSAHADLSSILVDDEGELVAVTSDDNNWYSVEDINLEANASTNFDTDVVNGADELFVAGGTLADGDTLEVKAEGGIDISSQDAANSAIETINSAIETVSAERSKLGAHQNRLDHTINNLGTSSENLTAAESRIRDVDMAAEMMNQTKNSILGQASQAMLAQANSAPQGVLQLLQ